MRFDKIKGLFFLPVTWVVLAGFSVRLYSALARSIVNADAHHYIYQAQVIYAGDWSALFSCGIKHISTYPFFTAMAFAIVRDWIAAGLAVNILFGTAVLVPLYLLLRRFAEETTSALCILVFALLPTFVNSSGDIIRNPVFCFFIGAGIYFFVRRWDEKTTNGRFQYDMVLAGLSFIMATGTRIEGILFLAVTPVYILFSKTEHKGGKLLCFVLPLVGAGAVGIAFVLLSGADASVALRLEKVWGEATQFIQRYGLLDDALKSLIQQNKSLTGEFLRRTREALWLMPLTVLLHNSIEVFFYPYALIFTAGFVSMGRRIKNNPGAAYFLVLMAGSLAVLLVHLVQTWIFIHRFLAILILPGCLVMAWGIENILQFLGLKFHLQKSTSVKILLAFIVLTGLPKVLLPRESDKAVYRQSARLIQATKQPDGQAGILSVHNSRAFEWLVLYSHRKSRAPVCAREWIRTPPPDYNQFLADFDKTGLGFFMFEERYWPGDRFDFLSVVNKKDFSLLGQWEHKDSGRLLLFQRIKS